MTDPQLVFLVSAIVVTGLVAWVVTVLLRAPRLEPADGPRDVRESADGSSGGSDDDEGPASQG